jgi:hypothetical protein
MKASIQVSPFFVFIFSPKRALYARHASRQHKNLVSQLFYSLLALTIPPRRINCNAKIGKSKYRSELFCAGAAAEASGAQKHKKILNIHNLCFLF